MIDLPYEFPIIFPFYSLAASLNLADSGVPDNIISTFDIKTALIDPAFSGNSTLDATVTLLYSSHSVSGAPNLMEDSATNTTAF